MPLVVANAATQGLFGVSLRAFVTGNAPFGDQGPLNNNSWEITGKELFNAMVGGSGGISSSFNFEGSTGLGGAIRYNLSRNGLMMASTIIATPILAKAMTNVLKDVRTPVNRLLKPVGVMV